MIRLLQGAFARARTQSTRFDRGRSMVCGYETRTHAEAYHWHGLKRGGDRRHPYVVMQFTLFGHGAYRADAVEQRCQPGSIMTAVVPSDHAYYLPADSSRWTFFWFITSHSFFVQRAIQRVERAGAVIDVGVDHAAFEEASRLVVDLCGGAFARPDSEYIWESRLLSVLCRLDEAASSSLYPARPRERLLAAVRQQVTSDFSRAPAVEAIADELGLSRTGFSHRFRIATGKTPLEYITELRLAEVRRLLTMTDEPLKLIARSTGYADANHLCKAFRRHHRMSPGRFRAQVR